MTATLSRPAAAVAAALLTALPLPAQEPPERVARDYLRSIEGAAWRAAAQRLHPEALAGIRRTIEILVDADRSGNLLERLSGERDAAGFLAVDDTTLFVSAMRALTEHVPGLVNAMTDRDTDVIGPVAEGDSLRHVVYRLEWRLSGARPEMKVMSLAREEGAGWRVLHAPELESIRPALRGLPRR